MTSEITSELIDDYINGKVDVPVEPRELGRALLAATRTQRTRLHNRLSIEMGILDLHRLWEKAEAFEAYLANTTTADLR